MKRLLAIGLVVLWLSGCAIVEQRRQQEAQRAALQRQQEAHQRAQQIALECRQKRLAGELPGYVASVLCSKDRMRQVIAESGYPYMDLVDLQHAYRLALARRVDEGQLSEEEFQVQMGELIVRLTNEARRRDAMVWQTQLQAQQAHNQWLQSYGTLLQGLGVWSQSLRQPEPRGPVTCFWAGNMITCH